MIKRLVGGLLAQLRSLWRLLLLIYLPILVLYIVIGVATKTSSELGVKLFFKDVVALGNLPVYAGFVSQLGMLFWSAATTICLFTWFSLRKMLPERREARNFLLCAGLLTAFLMLDDTFLLHEERIPFFPLSEKATFLGLGISTLLFLYMNWKEIMRSEYLILFIAFGFFGLSMGIDIIPSRFTEGREIFDTIERLFEDQAKFAAIVTWCAYFARYGYRQLTGG